MTNSSYIPGASEPTYQVQQGVTGGHQFEPVPEGDFVSQDAAVAAMRELVDELGWDSLRVIELPSRDVVATSGDVVIAQSDD